MVYTKPPSWKIPNFSLPTTFEADPTAAGLLKLLCFMAWYSRCPHCGEEE